MTYVDWMIKGPKLGACSCAYGCPCEFNGPPTHGMCEGCEAHLIEAGWFGDVRLDGLIIGAAFRWPGAVHEGGGTVQGFIDERATQEQREALFAILGGEEQEPTTVFNIYGSTIENELDPVFAPLEFGCDFTAQTGYFKVPGVMDMTLEPIRNPVTGADHFAQIVLPGGFEFKTGEMASSDFEIKDGAMAMKRSKSYGVLCYSAYGPFGIIAEESAKPN